MAWITYCTITSLRVSGGQQFYIPPTPPSTVSVCSSCSTIICGMQPIMLSSLYGDISPSCERGRYRWQNPEIALHKYEQLSWSLTKMQKQFNGEVFKKCFWNTLISIENRKELWSKFHTLYKNDLKGLCVPVPGRRWRAPLRSPQPSRTGSSVSILRIWTTRRPAPRAGASPSASYWDSRWVLSSRT